MNYTQLEITAELNRERIREQIDEIRIQDEVNSRTPNRRDLLAYAMSRLADWMVSAGTSLRQRYEQPCLECPQPGSANLAAG